MCHSSEQNRKHVKITVNKQETELPEGANVQELLELRGIKSRSSVWVNGKQLLLAEYPVWVLRDGDAVKILRVVAGG